MRKLRSGDFATGKAYSEFVYILVAGRKSWQFCSYLY